MERFLGDGWVLPAIDDATRAWFTSGELRIQECASCKTLQHPPGDVCCACQAADFGWRSIAGDGVVESIVTVQHAVHPALEDRVPYDVAVISLTDAPTCHAIGNIVDRGPGETAIGTRVLAVFEAVTDPESGEALLIPQWRAAEGESP